MKLFDRKFAVLRVVNLRLSDDFEKWHARSVEIDEALVSFDSQRLGRILLHLHSLDPKTVFLSKSVEKLKYAILHDRVVFLSDLVALGQVSVEVVLAIEHNLVSNRAFEGKAANESGVEALTVQHRQHSRERKVHEICVLVRHR